MEFQIGDIILFKDNGPMAKAVEYFTHSKYDHAAMVISNTHLIEANWYKKSNVVEFNYDPETMDVYRVNELTIEQQIAILQVAYNYIDKYYDYAQILGYIFEFFNINVPHHFNSSNKLICSELIDRAYSDIGFNLVPSREIGDVRPGDLPTSKLLLKVY